MRLVLGVLLGLLFATAVGAAAGADPHSAARLDQVRVRHLFLDLDLSFEQRQLTGFAELSLDWQRANARSVDLDTRDLRIERVLAADGEGHWRRAAFKLGPADPVLGQPLRITLREQAPKLRIYYRTSPSASGLQWLTPAQTLGKQQPFMFSQAQAIHARSFVPLQDTPAQRFSYSAHISAPPGIRVLMSADNDPQASGRGGYRFEMPQAIPSYLLAIAAGDLAYREIGPRSGVYAEPGRLAAAASEFADTEAMIVATEKLYGPYRWGRYDLLILPPSFPFGGMENPRLSFITPTVIAGDKSLVSLIAHELAHSWSGNLVTNASWRDAWLNEGFTSYVENRIVESVYGVEAAEMQQVIGQHELLEELPTLPVGSRALLQTIEAGDPDNAFSGVPYTKGEWLLRTLEQRFGRERFDPVLRAWFDGHAFQSVDSDEFLRFFGARLFDLDQAPMNRAEVGRWLREPVIPDSARRAQSARLDAVDAARADFLGARRSASELAAGSWSTAEWLHFLNGLPETTSAAQLADLDAAYRLTGTGNAEIAFRFYLAGIRADYPPIRSALKAHLIAIGRRKLVVPLWTELARTPANKAWALAVYAEARPGYHPIAQATIDPLLGFRP
ncbi:MAG: M1 family metallopeptidase [Lysobacterales bacterium]